MNVSFMSATLVHISDSAQKPEVRNCPSCTYLIHGDEAVAAVIKVLMKTVVPSVNIVVQIMIFSWIYFRAPGSI